MDRRAPRPRQPIADEFLPTGGLAAAADDGFDVHGVDAEGGPDGVLSYMHGVAIVNQPTACDTGPVMVPVAVAARVSDKDNQDPTVHPSAGRPDPGSVAALLRHRPAGATSADRSHGSGSTGTAEDRESDLAWATT
jgi:hypothetical protein